MHGFMFDRHLGRTSSLCPLRRGRAPTILGLVLTPMLTLVLTPMLTLVLTPMLSLATSAQLVEITTTAELATYLRAGDSRLVRPSPSTTTATRQREAAVLVLLPAVLQELIDTNATSVCDCDDAVEQSSHATAAETLHLLTTDSPNNRALIGASPDALAGLVSLVGESLSCNNTASSPSWRAAEEAAEALWILAFNSPSNHKALLELGAPEALAAPLLTPHAPPRCKMWAAAALQNLAASYCATADGRCSWEWAGDPGAQALEVRERLTIDAEAARRRIAAVPGLLHALVDLAAAPPPESGLLPSQALTSDRLAPGIAAWAAAGALKNLALSRSLRGALQGSAAPHALCALRASKCWLQSSKSQAALRYLDVDSCEAVLQRPKPPRTSLSHVLHLRHFDAPGLVEL